MDKIRVKLSFGLDLADLHHLLPGQLLLALLADLHGCNCQFDGNFEEDSAVAAFRHGVEVGLAFLQIFIDVLFHLSNFRTTYVSVHPGGQKLTPRLRSFSRSSRILMPWCALVKISSSP
jgi:hypothetical protein